MEFIDVKRYFFKVILQFISSVIKCYKFLI